VAGVTYTYDGDGKRVKESSGKLYWTGTGSDALAETDLTGVIQSEFTFFNGKRVARRDGSGNTVFYYFSDHLGSASVVTNATGTIVEESDYYPFGGERVITNSDPNQYKFTGKERDTESGLDYFIARHYSSNLGRFLQPDEFAGGPVDAVSSNDPLPDSPLPYADITNPQSLNKYSYTYNNPLVYVDPDGHEAAVAMSTAVTALLQTGGKLISLIPVAATAAAGGFVVGAFKLASDRTTEALTQNAKEAEQLAALTSVVVVENALNLTFAKATEAVGEASTVAGDLKDRVDRGEIKGEGAKGSKEASKHADKLQKAADSAKNLQDKLGKASGKAKEVVKKELDKLVKEIEGHVKEIKQKWPKAE
jgi:RHS repeat-associated protein